MTRCIQRVSLDGSGAHVSSSWRQHRDTRRRAGFTLAEVAIALVIFVFGALAIVRIFPPALDVIRNSENRTTATLLAQGTTERWRRETNLVPDAIFDTDYLSPTPPPTPYPGAVTGTASRNYSLPTGVLESQFAASALGHFRQIVGEKQVVRSNTTANESFVLTQFPFDVTTGVRVYRETTLSGATITSNGDLFQQDGTALPAGLYYVSYRWKNGGQFAGGVVDEPVITTTTSARVLRGGAGNIDDGPVAVRRRELIATVTPTNPNPFLGYVPVTGATPGQTVSVDYTVADWRWLVDEKVPTVMPGNIIDTPSDVNDYPGTTRASLLPVRYISDEFPVFGLLAAPDASDPGYKAAIQVGQWYQYTASAPFVLPAGATVDQQQRKQDLLRKSGHVMYNAGSINGPRARTVYRATDGWAHQLSVAARSYLPYVTGRDAAMDAISPQERWREYSWNPGADPNYLYFHPNEAGKTVLVTYQYGSPLQTRDNLVTINEDLISTPPTVLAGFETSGRVARVAPFLDAAGNQVPASAVLAVRGLGVQARTAWISGDRYSQSVVADYRRMD